MDVSKAVTVLENLGVLVQHKAKGILSQITACFLHAAILQGEVFHWTISLGASIAESSNFFTTAGGTSLACLWRAWQSHAQEAASTHGRVDVAGRLADTLTSFGVLNRRT